jgi:hypothetical protein
VHITELAVMAVHHLHCRTVLCWHLMLYKIVSLNSTVSCGTTPMAARSDICVYIGRQRQQLAL